jgi:hypothetical protein
MTGKEIVDTFLKTEYITGKHMWKSLAHTIDAAIAAEREACFVEGDRFCVCGTGLDALHVPKGMCCVCQYQKAIRARITHD